MSFGEVADITGLPGIHIEVKRVEKLNVCEAMSNRSGIVSGWVIGCQFYSTGETESHGL